MLIDVSARGAALLSSPTYEHVRWGWEHLLPSQLAPARPGSSRALPALLKGFELQTSAKNPGGKALHSGGCIRLSAPDQQPPNCFDYILESQSEGKLLGSFEAPGLV